MDLLLKHWLTREWKTGFLAAARNGVVSISLETAGMMLRISETRR
jgi:hypothetical protein